DVDIRVRIAPNATEENINLFFDSQDGFESYKVRIKTLIRSLSSRSDRVTLEIMEGAVKREMPELVCTINYEDEDNDKGSISIAMKNESSVIVGKIVQERYKPIQKPEDTVEELQRIEKERKQKEKEGNEVFKEEELKEYLKENNKEAHAKTQDAKKRAVDRTVHKDLLTDDEVVQDNWGQYMPRNQKRYLSRKDVEGMPSHNPLQHLQENGIQASGKATSLSANVLGDRDGGGRLSVTKQVDHQITGGYTGEETSSKHPKPVFNNNGAIDIDMAKIPMDNETFDVSTEHGRQQLMNERSSKKKLKGDGMIRGLTDVMRTEEVLVKEEIPGRAITNYQTKEEVNKNISTKVVERPDKDGNVLKERTPKEGFTQEEAKKELAQVKFDVVSLSTKDKSK
ncbi:MAG: hypothetical protein ACRBFS_16670, partial [Aureispira sp.]